MVPYGLAQPQLRPRARSLAAWGSPPDFGLAVNPPNPFKQVNPVKDAQAAWEEEASRQNAGAASLYWPPPPPPQ